MFVFLLLSVCLLVPSACGDDPVNLEAGDRMELVLTGLRGIDPAREGALELWAHGADGGVTSAGRLDLPPTAPDREVTLTFQLPVANPVRLSITLEPPGDTDQQRSIYTVMEGPVKDGRAELSIERSVTTGLPLQEEPGAHSLFTTSNNVELGYPSLEDAGLWMFSTIPERNRHGTREVKVTQLTAGWMYEGWIVKGLGSGDEIWVSYGKFRPDENGLLSARDDTGSGPFSGDEDYLNAGVEDVPGDEWSTDRVASQLGYQLPGGLTAPLDLDEVDPVTGDAIWHHVITIEPRFDEGEPMYVGQPFMLRPYRNPVGEGTPADPRIIELQETGPRGEARRISG
jgi:hypothetical protein